MTRLTLALVATLLSACAHVSPPGLLTVHSEPGSHSATQSSSQRSLKPFESPQQLRQLMASVEETRRIAREQEVAKWRAECRAEAKSDAEAIACSTLEFSPSQTVTVAGQAVASITNNQHPGVDEGDIVKRQGDVLIVLRRGRLFTIGIGGRQLDSLAVADAFGPSADGLEAERTWYDELLVWQRTVVVIGYSYSRGGTEIGLFDLGDHGELQHRSSYHLRSDDYYTTRNYASRLIGDRLLLFTSLELPENVEPNAWLPAMRRWTGRGTDDPFETIAPINRVFQPVAPLDEDPVVHTLISCRLSAPALECEASVLLGEPLNVFYASPTAAYAWTTAWRDNRSGRSILYRLPLDGGPVSAIGVTGYPPDHLAFLEDASDHLNVVVAQPNDAVALLRFPLYAFSDGSLDVPTWFYRPIARGTWVIARFVGDYVVVGTPAYDADDESGRRVVVTAWQGNSTVSLKLTHAVERIEELGPHAVVVGNDDEHLSMTAIRLGNRPTVAGTFVERNSSQAEYRSHAFLYRSDGREDGLFGIPVETTSGTDGKSWDRPARILFIQNRGLTFSPIGTLDPRAKRIDDRCRVSCVDWYGNARPIFIDDRIFALSGYELIEGRLVGGRVERVDRLDFAPRTTDVP